MAKEKIRKLIKQRETLTNNNTILTNRVNNLAAMLAYLVDKNGGEIVLPKEGLENMPDAAFKIDANDTGFVLKLVYDPVEQTS